MRRTSSEIIRNLQQRVARLERRAGKYVDPAEHHIHWDKFFVKILGDATDKLLMKEFNTQFIEVQDEYVPNIISIGPNRRNLVLEIPVYDRRTHDRSAVKVQVYMYEGDSMRKPKLVSDVYPTDWKNFEKLGRTFRPTRVRQPTYQDLYNTTSKSNMDYEIDF